MRIKKFHESQMDKICLEIPNNVVFDSRACNSLLTHNKKRLLFFIKLCFTCSFMSYNVSLF